MQSTQAMLQASALYKSHILFYKIQSLAVGGILSTGFEQQLLMGNNAILNYSDVLDTYAYRYGLAKGMYSYGTAVGLFKSIVSFILVMSANKITAKLNDSALF
jgi:putative aldouronate transport system permease protein